VCVCVCVSTAALRRGEGVLWHVLGLNAVEHVAVRFPVINWPAAFSYACIGAQFVPFMISC
jgi:hypothetical protein